jgi:hypothetical protein
MSMAHFHAREEQLAQLQKGKSVIATFNIVPGEDLSRVAALSHLGTLMVRVKERIRDDTFELEGIPKRTNLATSHNSA